MISGTRVIAALELRRFFLSATPYVAAATLQTILGVVFFSNLSLFILRGGESDGLSGEVTRVLYLSTGTLFLFIGPLLTMHSFSDEYRRGTMTLLLSSPIPLPAIVLGKFLATIAIFACLILLYSVMPLSLLFFTPVSLPSIGWYAAALGLFCLPIAAIGIYASSLTDRPAAAAAGTLAGLLFFWLLELPSSFTTGALADALNRFSITRVYADLLNGYLAFWDLAYLSLLCVLFLTLSVRRLHGLRSWS